MKPDELWKTYGSRLFSKQDFLAALHEYGQAVRARDAEIAGRHDAAYRAMKDAHDRNCKGGFHRFDAREFGMDMEVIKQTRYIAEDISREPLP